MADLTGRVEVMRDHAAAGRIGALVAEDFSFHVAVCQASGNRRFVGLIADLAAEMHMVIALIGQIHADPVRIAETHAPLLTALASRDETQLRALWLVHIKDAWLGVRQLLIARAQSCE